MNHIDRECRLLGHEWACDHENDPPVCLHCGTEGVTTIRGDRPMGRKVIEVGGTRGVWVGANEAKALATTMDMGARLSEERGALAYYELRANNLHRTIAALLRHLGDNGGGIISVDPRDA